MHIAGPCDPEAVEEISLGRTLLIVDCEGCELDILRPDLAPRLEEAISLVELHDHIRPGVTEEILDRFSATYDARTIHSEHAFRATTRSSASCPGARAFSPPSSLVGSRWPRGSSPLETGRSGRARVA